MSAKVIPENIIYKGFNYAFEEVKSKVCLDPKCTFYLQSYIYDLQNKFLA